MKVLIVNDDGLSSDGLKALVKAFTREHEVCVVVPAGERSGASMSFTFMRPLELKKVDVDWAEGARVYTVSGFPVDCTKFGIKVLMPDADIVISGINIGANLGTDITLSGTCGAAMAASYEGVPAISASQMMMPKGGMSTEHLTIEDKLRVHRDFTEPAEFVLGLAESVGEWSAECPVLNVNFPTVEWEEIKGIRACTTPPLDYGEYYHLAEETEEGGVYFLRGSLMASGDDSTDVGAVRKGYITITPLRRMGADEEKLPFIREKYEK